MSSYVAAALRRLVQHRAERLCEYCMIHEDDTYFGCEVDHVISEKHGGVTESEKLAYACFFCNHYKGTDVGSVLGSEPDFVRFNHPRRDRWSDHFELQGARIAARSSIGIVTARILRFNDEERLMERTALIAVQRYPSASARLRISPPGEEVEP